MKKYILFTLMAVVTLCLMSCIDEDDFIQEGNLGNGTITEEKWNSDEYQLIYIYPYENIQINPYAPVYLYRRKCRQRDIHDKH